MKTKENIRLRCQTLATMAIALILSLIFPSCEKLAGVPEPENQLSAKTVYDSEATAQNVLNGLYSQALDITSGNISATILGAYSSDETELYSTSAGQQQLFNNQLIPTNTYSSSFWSSCYSAIYTANVLMEGTAASTALSQETKGRIRGEALFFRALAHLYLTSFYGNVPVITTTDYKQNTVMPQSTSAQVLQQVISDLTESASLLPTDFSISAGERIRANSYAAKALLARAYLYAGENEKAEAAASEVIANTGLFSLGTPAETFVRNSRESIFQLRPNSTSFNTTEGNFFILLAKPTTVAMRRSFYDGFEAGDNRKAQWTGKVAASGTDYYFSYKYKVKTSTALSEYSTVLRLAELYLIRSEARARQDKLQLAISDLDAVRSRAGLPRIATTNPSIPKDALLDAILFERRSELFFEGAHRWTDLKRFARSQAILSPLKSGWKATSLLFPIPNGDILINYNLVQNPGY